MKAGLEIVVIVLTVAMLVPSVALAALHLIGGGFHNRVHYQDRKFKDFSLEVRMRKTSGNYAGVVVRGHWRMYLQIRSARQADSAD